MPLALIDRMFVDGPTRSALALRLFHALLFIAWNVIDIANIHRPLAYHASSLRRAIGRRRISKNDLRVALQSLTECQFWFPAPDEPDKFVTAPLLDWQHVERDRRVFWSFSDPV